MIQKLFKNRFFLALIPFLFITLATAPAVSAIAQKGYFPMHDDLQAMRQLQMDKCFSDGQIPCRWVPDMGYGYGYPLFNYYPPFPYYLGEAIHLLGFSFLDTIKVLYILVFLTSGFAMYLLAKEFWGRLGGIVSAVFYVWAPYHAVDVYVRGAMNEAWAVVFFPAILWSLYKLIVENRWIFVVWSALFIALAALSHNPTLMVFIPGALIWVIFWVFRTKSLKKVFPKLAISGIWALGLAAFFTIPVILELKYVHFESLFIGYFNYLAHFLNLDQLFISRYWGYGSSFFGTEDTMSFSVGHLHWIASLASLIAALKFRKQNPKISLVIIFFFAWTLIYTFLAHQRSALIWKIIPQLASLQFPWRMLALTMLGTSFLAGSMLLLLNRTKQHIRIICFGMLILAVVIFNYSFFTWREFYPEMTDEQKFSGREWELQKTAGIFDYLPNQIPLPPANPPDGDAKFIAGDGEFTVEKKVSNIQIFEVDVKSDSATFQINTFYFPGWKVFVDGQEISIDPYRDKEYGIMIVDLPKGEHKVVAEFNETPIRKASNAISAFSWLILILVLLFPLRKLPSTLLKK
ncbi:MAG TPA: 6-pyruvoyl-tetrahydropterin synthase-related protein [Patescibacteria group bacterium]